MLYTFVLDLKLTPEGRVKILELQQPIQSGAVGYEQAYGHCMARDRIAPFYRERLGLTPFIQDRRMQAEYSEHNKVERLRARPDFNPGDLSTYTALFSPRYKKGHYAGWRPHLPPHIAIVNDNSLFMAAAESKYLQHIFFTPHVGALAPEETAVTRAAPKDMARDITAAVTTPRIVIKLPEAARAEAVFIVERKDLEKALAFLYAPLFDSGVQPPPSLTSSFNHYAGAWKSGGHAVIAQSFEDSLPVINPQDGKTYAPTMRVFATAWADRDGTPRLELHGTYWKFPDQPSDGSPFGAARTISASPTKKPGAPVSAAHRAMVEEQLQGLLPAFAALEKTDAAALIAKAVATRNTAEVHALLNFINVSGDDSALDRLTQEECTAFAHLCAEYDLQRGTQACAFAFSLADIHGAYRLSRLGETYRARIAEARGTSAPKPKAKP
jgi:hypothetical protein